MKSKFNTISTLLYGIILSVSLCKLTYGTDPLIPLDNDSLYCLDYANCTGDQCRFNRMGPTNQSRSFNGSNDAGFVCDGLNVTFNFSDPKKGSFLVNESVSCYRYYDAVGHHFVIAMITINKPNNVETSNIICQSSIGSCTLLNKNGTSSGLDYVAGIPDMCQPGITFQPSKTDTLMCEGVLNCTGDSCRFNRTVNKPPSSRVYYPDQPVTIPCNSLKVEVSFPPTNDTQGNETFSCFDYENENGKKFTVAEMTFSKLYNMTGSAVSCKTVGDQPANCVLLQENATQLAYYAGVPNNCTPWTPPPATTTVAPTTTTTVSTPTTTTTTTTSTKSDNIPTTSNTTAGTTTTAGPTGTTAAGSNTTAAPSVTTAAGEVTTAKGKDGSTGSSLESTTFIVIAAFFLFVSRQNLEM